MLHHHSDSNYLRGKPHSKVCNWLLFLFLLLACGSLPAPTLAKADSAAPAAYAPQLYLSALTGKRIAVVVNQTSEVNGTLLPDALLARSVNVRKIMVPEHGFRGREEAGAHIDNTKDSATGLPVISLYGKNKKPTAEQLSDIDAVVFDLQDVGVRFYTYLSTMEYCMEACAALGKQFIVLDRPNPNGFYVDGPVLEKKHRSFVGMQAIPVVHGMTAGEYALMLKGENLIEGADNLNLRVIPCINYTHSTKYSLPVPPSPNLRTMEAVYAYASLCLFEGTSVSLGRGTDKPFRQFGCPAFEGGYDYSFTPTSMQSALHPPHEGKKCYGKLVAPDVSETLTAIDNKMRINWIIEAYNAHPDTAKFFTPFFTTLAGTTRLRQQIQAGMSEKQIRKTWEKELAAFRKVRKKYLLYPDFRN